MRKIADPIADSIADPVGAEERRRRGPLADFFYRLVREKPLGLVGAVIIVLFVLVSVFADVLAPDPEQRQDVTRRLQGSSAEHLLGTDHTGRDFLNTSALVAQLTDTGAPNHEQRNQRYLSVARVISDAGPLIDPAKAVRQLLPTGDDERYCCQVSYSRE